MPIAKPLFLRSCKLLISAGCIILAFNTLLQWLLFCCIATTSGNTVDTAANYSSHDLKKLWGGPVLRGCSNLCPLGPYIDVDRYVEGARH